VSSRDKRSRVTGRLGAQRGERYALLPLEVAQSGNYQALPDWAARVLFALLLSYHGRNNGCLGLTFPQAKTLGVSSQWKLYSGLHVLMLADLIICTRQGRLVAGKKLPSLYALTWKGIDQPQESVSFDGSISPCPLPSNSWARWSRPHDWNDLIARISRKMRGRTEIPHSIPGGAGRSIRGGAEGAIPAPSVVEWQSGFSAPSVVEASKNSGVGSNSQLFGQDLVIARLMETQPHLLDLDIARSCRADLSHVARVRAIVADGWHA
jgi:hypothetical protein